MYVLWNCKMFYLYLKYKMSMVSEYMEYLSHIFFFLSLFIYIFSMKKTFFFGRYYFLTGYKEPFLYLYFHQNMLQLKCYFSSYSPSCIICLLWIMACFKFDSWMLFLLPFVITQIWEQNRYIFLLK